MNEKPEAQAYCNHTWEVTREPLKMICTKCNKLFNANDKDCADSLGKTWIEDMTEGLVTALRKYKI